MAEEKRIVNPPNIQDASDNDPPSEYLQLRYKVGYPPKDINENVVNAEIRHSKQKERQKTLKTILLAIIGVVYTYILLSVR